MVQPDWSQTTGYRPTLRVCNNSCLCTKIKVTRTYLDVIFIVRCLPFKTVSTLISTTVRSFRYSHFTSFSLILQSLQSHYTIRKVPRNIPQNFLDQALLNWMGGHKRFGVTGSFLLQNRNYSIMRLVFIEICETIASRIYR